MTRKRITEERTCNICGSHTTTNDTKGYPIWIKDKQSGGFKCHKCHMRITQRIQYTKNRQAKNVFEELFDLNSKQYLP